MANVVQMFLLNRKWLCGPSCPPTKFKWP